MGLKIHQLPQAIANQIAAGEVIERPASVVKELLENSLDAGASEVIIEIGYGGLNQIRMSDNGCGIHAEDLPLAIAAHATSKITKLDDLYAINSMGFRGEALASIASVAKVTLSSKPAQQETAMMLQVKNFEQVLLPCARTTGTTIDVVDLFFNAPVRKRFLKSEKLEFQAIERVVKCFALSAPEIAITLKHNNNLVLSLPEAVNEKSRVVRIGKIFGSGFMKEAHFIHAESGSMKLEGWVSGLAYQRSQKDRLWIYINQRMVRDKLIHHAIKQAYDDLLHPGRFPSCLLYLTINTDEIDVNVHPTKHEVRFQQPRLVHDFFISQLSRVLRNNRPAPIQHQQKVFELCEPAMEFSSLKVKPSAIPSLEEQAWISLNKDFVMVFFQQGPCIVDVGKLYWLWLSKQLKLKSLPLELRPLLVPVSFSCSQKVQQRLESNQGILSQLGIHIELKSCHIAVKSIPVMMPYLDLKALFQCMEQAENTALETLVCQSQLFDLVQLSLEERGELNQLLLDLMTQESEIPGLYKQLTSDECRIFLNA